VLSSTSVYRKVTVPVGGDTDMLLPRIAVTFKGILSYYGFYFNHLEISVIIDLNSFYLADRSNHITSNSEIIFRRKVHVVLEATVHASIP
jgi:hypothetical protein